MRSRKFRRESISAEGGLVSTILVVGATGELGGLIARTLLDQGQQVRAMVRSGSSSDALKAAGADTVMGDLKDAESLRAACEGVSAVVTTANSVGRGGADTVESVDRQGNRNLVTAASAAGVERFVFISALGAAADNPNPFLGAKGETEDAVRSSGMTWTILEPNLYMDIWIALVVGGPALSQAPVTLVGEGRRKHSMVVRSDVAAFAVAALGRQEAENQMLVIGGPDAVTWRDVIAAFERELDREVPVQSLPPGGQIPGFPEVMNGLVTALDSYDSPIDMTDLARTYGVRPTPLEEFVRGFVAASRSSR